MKTEHDSNIVQESPWAGALLRLGGHGLKELKFSKIHDFLKDKQGTLLEIGCGHGKMIYSLHALIPGISYSGCDANAEAIEYCRSRYPFADFTCQAAEALSSGKKYDFVLLADVLEHVQDYRKVLANARALLRDGGYCVMVTATEGDPNIYRLLRIVRRDWSERTRGHINYYSKRELFGEIRRHFTIEKIEYMYHVLGSLFDAVIFFATLNATVRRLFERSGDSDKNRNGFAKRFISFFDSIAFFESRLLVRSSAFASCQFIVAKKDVSK